jgi:hypothetical protein
MVVSVVSMVLLFCVAITSGQTDRGSEYQNTVDARVKPTVFAGPPIDENEDAPPEEAPEKNPLSSDAKSSPGGQGSEKNPWLKTPLLKDSFLEDWGQKIEQKKAGWPISVSGGAYHWWHINNGGPLDSGYGVPGVPGTHSYYLFLDEEHPVEWGNISKIGGHIQMRFRDSGVPLRPFYINDDFWFWEAYGFLDTPLGRLKMGSIYKQFGMFWDDSWWGNVQYMDGFKLNSAYGLSLEDTPEFKNDDFKIDRFLQFFLAEDRVSGAILGADSESFAGSNARNTFIGRLVPTWKLGEKQTFALGISATVGAIDNASTLFEYGTGQAFASPGNQTISGWAIDGTWTTGPWKVFAEASQLYGTLTPRHYVSQGPSNRYTDTLAGVSYARGPLTYRCVYSYGIYDNPYGCQGMLVPGITAKITRNITLWCEYTYWDSRCNSSSQTSVLENGYQMIFDWHF